MKVPRCAALDSYLISFLWKMPFGKLYIDIVLKNLLHLYFGPCTFFNSAVYYLINSFSKIFIIFLAFGPIRSIWVVNTKNSLLLSWIMELSLSAGFVDWTVVMCVVVPEWRRPFVVNSFLNDLPYCKPKYDYVDDFSKLLS